MVTRPNCTVHTEPDPGCEGCEDQFCADCAMPLTNRNSGLGMDICDDCEERSAESETTEA